MAGYNHGVRVIEEEAALVAPVEGTAGLQVIFGTAPVNLAANPKAAVNKPIICYSYSEFVENFGYSNDFKKYTLCQSADACSRVFAVAPVIFVNVLDPEVHKKENTSKQYTVVNNQATVNVEGILLDSLKVMSGESELAVDTDYVASFDSDGHVIVTLLESGAGNGMSAINVTCNSIDASLVTKNDVIGGYDTETGAETGIETVRQIYPRFGLTPGLLLAPGWSKDAEVAAVLASKCENLNGVFRCECLLDIDTTKAKKYTDCKQVKEDSGFAGIHSVALWPCLKLGEKIYAYSAVYGALVAYTDAANDDVPNLSPSNKLLNMTDTVLEDGTEVILDQVQANMLNGQGIVTAINDNGWKAWGNNTAAYPGTTDPKDRWICCRRFFSWWANSFILTYKQKVDDPANRKLIEAVVDSENIRGNSYVSQGKCAGARMEFRADDNPVTGLLNGQLVFRQHLAAYTPAEDMANILAFDPDMLQEALS